MSGFSRGASPRSMARQQGVALVVVLMLLLIVTMLGLAGIRGALLQERMAANAYARVQAFQATEAVLREAETVVAQNWQANNEWIPTAGNSVAATTSINDMASRYSIELLGPAVSREGVTGSGSTSNPDLKGRIEAGVGSTLNKGRVYRITATSTNADNGVEVQLESLYELSRE
jgi:type IV pilus assembly protein PilX